MADEVALDMADVSIRRLSHDDLAGALALSSAAGWNQRASDWAMLVDLASAGCFAATSGGRIVGTAIGIDYTGFSWVAMMLVEPAYRGRGLGRRLLESVLAAVPADTSVRLDATPMGRPLYESCGFEDEAAITRWAGSTDRPRAGSRARLKAGATGAAAAACAVRSMRRTDLATLADGDREVFGADRRAVLAWALDSAPEYAHVIEDRAAGAPRQYCLGRHGRLFDQIGPVVATSDEAARALACAALDAARGPVVIDAFDEQRRFADWLQAGGFHGQRPLFRMRRPPRRGERRPDRRRPERTEDASSLVQFAIFGPDFA
jgi:GNAT superfamily N-acetyltransferase